MLSDGRSSYNCLQLGPFVYWLKSKSLAFSFQHYLVRHPNFNMGFLLYCSTI